MEGCQGPHCAALTADAPKPVSLLSLILQDDNINVVQGLKHILKVHSCLMKLASQCPVGWSITKVVLSRLREENRGKVYQGCELQFQGCHYQDLC